jgi:plastocyanin
MRFRYALGAVVGILCVAAHGLAATKIVVVGPGGSLTFADQETGTSMTTVAEGDSVQWVWDSSGHSTTSDRAEEGWDSGVEGTPFSFTHQFPTAGTFPYHCIPHQSLGMTGMVVVLPAGGATSTTSTTLPSIRCDTQAVASVRAQIDGACNCAGALNHRAYVRCATRMIRKATKARAVPAACQGTLKRCAANSTCGRLGSVACCHTSAQGVQSCSIKPSALACTRRRGGSSCVSDQPSCCEACGGATCPAPPTTTTTSTPTAPTTTSSTMFGMRPMPQCFSDTDCPVANLCDGAPRCRRGVCVAGRAAFCPDGTPALWVGAASGLTDSADIVFRICVDDGFVSGTFARSCDFSPCFGLESRIFGTAFFSIDGFTIVFEPVVFATGDACTFDAQLVGLTMGGDFICVDPFGFIVNSGAWNTTRCP